MRRFASIAAALALAAACSRPGGQPAPAAPAAPPPEASPAAPDAPLGFPPAEAAAPAAAPAIAPADVDLDTLMGRVTPASDPRFTLLPAQYGNRAGHYGRIEAVDALVAMIEAARADGVRLTVVSAFRSFSHQAQIWNGKWRGDTAVGGGRLPETVPEPVERARRILEFSSMPGSSRHHWGTDFDLNSIDPAHFVAGEGKAAHDWLAANAGRFGFCQVYSAKGPARPTGYEEEKWHWSYMPLADPLLAAWLEQVDDGELAGFEGAEAAAAIGVAANYVAAIDPACAALAAPGG